MNDGIKLPIAAAPYEMMMQAKEKAIPIFASFELTPRCNFNCGMCSFKTICSTYMYAPLDESEVLEEFKEEFVKRDEDHLEEKTERSIDE